MTAIDINALTEEQKKQIAANFAAEEKAKKEKKAADKKLLKGLENDVVLKVIDYFIDKRNDIESRVVNLFKEIEPVIELRAEVFGNEKRDQDSVDVYCCHNFIPALANF